MERRKKIGMFNVEDWTFKFEMLAPRISLCLQILAKTDIDFPELKVVLYPLRRE